MKRFFTTLILIAVANFTFAQVQVTVNVDMNGVADFDSGTESVYISGTLAGGWAEPGTEAGNLMTDSDMDGIYTLVLSDIAAGDYEYKFFKVTTGSSSWDGGEWAGGDNRTVTVGTSPMVLDNIWGDIANAVNDISNNYRIFPNPSNGIFTVDAKGFSIKVFDVTGKTVATQISGTTVDMSNAQAGVYFVKLTSNDATFTKKIVVR